MPDNYKKKTKAQKQADAAAKKAAHDRTQRTVESYLSQHGRITGTRASADAAKKMAKVVQDDSRIIGESNKPLGLDLPVTNVKRTVKRTKRPPADKVKVKRGGLRMTRPQGMKKAIFRRKR